MVDSPKSLTIGRSNKVAFVYDAGTKTTRIYLDGVQTVSGTAITQEVYQLAQLAKDGRNYIGRTQWWDTSEAGNNNDYCGTIDNFQMFNVALTADEIKELIIATTVETVENKMTGNVFGLDRLVIGKGENITLYGDVRSENLKNLQVSLLDMSGRTVRRWMPSAFPVVLDGLFVTEGTYLVCVSSAGDRLWSSKLVIR